MRIVAISTVRNERDIIEAFVRHTATFVDHHLVLDNGSTDETLDIVAALAAEGCEVTLLEDPSLGFWQGRRMTRLMRMAADDLHADWVVPLDADEFLVTTPGQGMRRVLAGRSDACHLLWRTYVPSPEDDANETNPVVRIRHRRAEEGREWRKVVVPRSVASVAELYQGSHDVTTPADGARATLEAAWLAHFPVRRPEQYAVKVAIGKLQNLAKGSPPGEGFHYDAPFEMLMHDPEEFMASFREGAMRYALEADDPAEAALVADPIPYSAGELRHTPPPRSGDPWLSIFEYAVALSRAVCEANRRDEPPTS